MARTKGKGKSRTYALRSKKANTSSSVPKASSDIPEANNSVLNETAKDGQSAFDDNITLQELNRKLNIVDTDPKRTKYENGPSYREKVIQEIINNMSGGYGQWFKFVPKKSGNFEEYPPVLQSSHVRIKKVETTPVSVLLKYLKMKLNLDADSEVNVDCHGMRLSPDLLLKDISDIWESGLPDDEDENAYWTMEELVIKLEYYGKVKSQ